MIVKLLTEQHLEFLSSKGGCTGSSESTLVKICFVLLQAPATSILVPRSVIQVPESSNSTNSTEALPDKVFFQFIWYHNANLFPQVIKQHDDPVLHGRDWKVISGVISASFCK